MHVKSYIVDQTNKICGVSHMYDATGSHNIYASDNITDALFTTDESNQDQAQLYKTITFGSNVTSIPRRCCYKFTNLNVVTFAGSKVKSIGDESFFQCQSLQNIVIPQSVDGIGSNAFAACQQLGSVTFSLQKAINFGARAFFNTGIISLSMNAATVSNQAFAGCTKLMQASLNGALGPEMFNGCTALNSINVNGNPSTIPPAFAKGCTSLTSISFANASQITSIDNEAFYDCLSLTSFQLQDTSVTYVGGGVFYNSGVTQLTLPATITSPTQVNSGFLTGSRITKLKFAGISASYMDSNPTQFSAFGGDVNSLIIESSDGKTYRIDTSGLVIPQPGGGGGIVSAGKTTFIISVAISNSIPSNILSGEYKDSSRFISLVQQAYADKPELIVGIRRLNDEGTQGSDGIGNVANLNAAFDAAKAANAQFVIFHYSDHGARKNQISDGSLTLYGDKYTYQMLFAKLQMFQYAFIMLNCCYPYSTDSPFTSGTNGTKALFWCAGSPNQSTLMKYGVGAEFLSLLVRKFNASYTWKEQWEKIHVQHSRDRILPYQYIIGDFPVSSKVFRID